MTKFDITNGNDSEALEQSELSLKDIYYILRRHSKAVYLTVFTVLLLTVLITLLTVPTYESTTMLVVEEPGKSLSVFDLAMESSMNLLNNEIELLKSRTLAEEVVQELWNSNKRPNLFLFGSRVYEPEGLRKTAWDGYQWLTSFTNHKEMPSFTGSIDDSLRMEAVKKIRDQMTVANQRNTNVLKIAVTSPDPKEAALLANTVSRLYRNRDMEWSSGEIINLRDFLREQLTSVERDLQIVEDELRTFQEVEQIYGLEGNAKILLEQLAEIEARYYNTLAEINIIKERKRFITSRLSEEERTLTDQVLNTINNRLFALRTEIASNEADMVRNASMYGEQHDAVQSVQRKIKRLKGDLEKQTNTLIAQGTSVADPLIYRQALIDTVLVFEAQEAGLLSRANEYEVLVNQYSSQLNTLPAKSLQYARLERDRTVLAETYALMRQKFEEARITEASELGKVRIIDSAIAPKNRTKPKTTMNLLLGLILGTGLGVGFAFLLEYADNTVKSGSDIERQGLTLLGMIPVFGNRSGKAYRKKRKQSDPENNKKNVRQSEAKRIERHLITSEDPKSPISEAYRSLRTSLLYSTADSKVQTILISSPGPGEGKTTTVSNLAITYANLGKRTLLVDSDLRRPIIHRLFNIKQEPGLTQYLSGVTEYAGRLVQPTKINNLGVITSGTVPPNPSELLGSKRMQNMITRLEKEWDIILFDSPPIVAVTDATMLSTAVDKLILVVKSGLTNKDAFLRSIYLSKQVEVPISGVVLNAVTAKNTYGSYYYYYEYSKYYGKK